MEFPGKNTLINRLIRATEPGQSAKVKVKTTVSVKKSRPKAGQSRRPGGGYPRG